MFFLPLGIISGLAGLGVFAWTQNNGGVDATTTVSDHVLTGTTLYAIAVALIVAAVFFVVSAVLKTIRRFAALIAVIALAGGGGIAALVPDSVSSYVSDHCASQTQMKACDKLNKN